MNKLLDFLCQSRTSPVAVVIQRKTTCTNLLELDQFNFNSLQMDHFPTFRFFKFSAEWFYRWYDINYQTPLLALLTLLTMLTMLTSSAKKKMIKMKTKCRSEVHYDPFRIAGTQRNNPKFENYEKRTLLKKLCPTFSSVC